MAFASACELLVGSFVDGGVAMSDSDCFDAFPSYLVQPTPAINGATGLMIHDSYLYVSGLFTTQHSSVRFNQRTDRRFVGDHRRDFPQDLATAPMETGFSLASWDSSAVEEISLVMRSTERCWARLPLTAGADLQRQPRSWWCLRRPSASSAISITMALSMRRITWCGAMRRRPRRYRTTVRPAWWMRLITPTGERTSARRNRRVVRHSAAIPSQSRPVFCCCSSL